MENIQRIELKEGKLPAFVGPVVGVFVEKLLFESIETKVGELWVDNSYDPHSHMVRSGKVVSLPTSMKVGISRDDKLMPWETPVEIEIGDTVFFGINPVSRIINGHDKVFSVNGGYILGVNYKDISIAQRGDEVKILNGFVILKLLNIQQEDNLLGANGGIILPDTVATAESKFLGEVVAMGTPIKKYAKHRDQCDTDEIDIGDIVMFRQKTDIKIESYYHQFFPSGKDLVKVHRMFILAKILKRD